MNRNELAVYFIMGTQNVGKQQPLHVLQDALEAGITMFQLREKGVGALKGEAYENFAIACQRLCKQYDVPFIINDDVDIAIKLRADGVHIGQDDEHAAQVKKRIGSMLLGVSAHTEEEVQQAIANGADYVGVGPIYPTKTKLDAKAPTGTDIVQHFANKFPNLPIVAIGGITEQNVQQVLNAGADGVAVISIICKSSNRKQTVKLLQSSRK